MDPIHFIQFGANHNHCGLESVEVHFDLAATEAQGLEISSEGAFKLAGYLFIPHYLEEAADTYTLVYPLPRDYRPELHDLWLVLAHNPDTDDEQLALTLLPAD